ncbi:hypothetical protein DXG01_009811 [Tephrocybe rancida]|nr:hypothetical protein DXG01_009811 [Tephrocybe rancida]
MLIARLIPPPATAPAEHIQEATALSLTDTIVERDEHVRPGLDSSFTGRTIASPGFDARQDPEKGSSPTSASTSKLPPTIPPEYPHRTLVVCFDGTGDQFDADNLNIVQLVSLLKKNDRNKQMVYYRAGIGTYISPKVAKPLTAKLSKTLDEILVWNLDAHVMSGFEFLMQNYLDGNKICIFRLSRGAYTARSLAGMLHKVGLLPADNHQQVPFTCKMYTRADDIGWEQSNAFKLAFSSPVAIEFLGVWDTVDSIGIFPKRLPFTTSNTIIRAFRHVIALDERRAKFKLKEPAQQRRGNGKEGHEKGGGIQMSESQNDQKLAYPENMYPTKEGENHHKLIFRRPNVGGGSVDNKFPRSLAPIPLRSMLRQRFKTNTGMMFNTEALRTIGLDPATLYPYVLPRPPPRLDASSEFLSKAEKPLWFASIAARRNKKMHAAPSRSVTVNDHSVIDEGMEDLRDALSPVYDRSTQA